MEQSRGPPPSARDSAAIDADVITGLSPASTADPLATSQDGGKCRIIMRFMKARSAYEHLVASMVKSPVHVDIVLDRENTLHKRVCFSAYMNEKFSMSLMSKNMISDDYYENHAIEVSAEDLDRCSAYLGAMVGRIPYNYSDSMLLMPTLPHSGIFTSTMIQDVQPRTPPEKLSTVFCSQAAVLVCRECLRNSPWLGGLVDELSSTNSRLCSPSDLLSVVSKYSKVIPNSELECDGMESEPGGKHVY